MLSSTRLFSARLGSALLGLNQGRLETRTGVCLAALHRARLPLPLPTNQPKTARAKLLRWQLYWCILSKGASLALKDPVQSGIYPEVSWFDVLPWLIFRILTSRRLMKAGAGREISERLCQSSMGTRTIFSGCSSSNSPLIMTLLC